MILYCIVSLEAVSAAGGNRGKMMAQAGHAFVDAVIDSQNRFPRDLQAYLESGVVKKVCLKAQGPEELRELYRVYRGICGAKLVTDAGLTVFNEPTLTALGLGPIAPDGIGDDLKALKVFI
jgi:peptidyl-tRNA hydrolase